MMMSACGLHHVLNTFIGYEISLNDVCVFIPAGFSCITVFFTYLLTVEVSRSPNAGVGAAGIMALLPAHLMRSVAGGYDNESVAVAAICSTFYFWVRSLRGENSWWVGAVAGLSYCYMAAAWGGYTFVLNMVGVHASALILLGRYTPKLHQAYSLFFIIGTAGALQVPVIGWQPLQSVEQLGPLACFCALNMIACADLLHRLLKLPADSKLQMRLVFIAVAIAAGAVLVNSVLPDGYLGPVSARVRGLFVKHTKTGNPLVDSVAEHQATPTRAYPLPFRYHSCATLRLCCGSRISI